MSTTTDSSIRSKTETSSSVVVVNNVVQQSVNTSVPSPILTTASKSSVSSLPSVSSSLLPSSSPSVNSSNKKIRKSDSTPNENNNNFLPIAPQTFFQPSNHQGLTLASVQQQLQPVASGSVAVFTSPTMTMATLAGAGPQTTVQQQGTSPGGHSQQQLVVTPTGQAMAPQFSGTFQTNGQTHQLIQTPGMGMMGGLPQVQVIGTNGQPAYFPQFYTGQMQPMLLNNLTMAIPTQNTGQSLAIQLPNAPNTGGTMITTGQMTQAANTTTPVKNQTNQTTIVKGVTISPQQQPQAKSNASSISNGKTNTSTSPATQQAIIQQTTTFQQNATNQTFVIGLPGSGHQQNGTTILPSTPTNARKTTGSGRSNNGNKQNSNLVQKIQPAASPLLAQTQFKPNTSFSGTPNTNSPANGQTIMVHGQGIQPGPGGIQLANQPTIISPLAPFQTIQPSITWASPQLNQQSAQLVAPNGQILIRTQGPNDSSHMLIQTSNNQFQAVPMQMTPGTQQQSQNGGGMQVTQGGQPMMTSSINQPLPIPIQTNQGVAMSSTTMVTQQTNNTSTNMLTVVSSSTNTPTMSTSTTMAPAVLRQRPLRPASTQQSTISTQTTATKPKIIESNRTSSANVPKLAPKGLSSSVMNTNLSKSQQNSNTLPKLPLPALPKISQLETNLHVTTGISTNNLNIVNNKTSTAKISTSTQSVSSSMVGTTSSTTTTPSLLGLNSNNNLVSGASHKFENQFNKNPLTRKTEKKDASSSTENKSTAVASSSPLISTQSMNSIKSMKTNAQSLRNNTNSVKSNSTQILPPSSNLFSSGNNQVKNNGLSQMVSTTGTTTKNSTLNGLTNGILTKSNSANTSGSKVIKSKQNENQVLTHIIDGYIIQESANPFPINGFLTFENMNNNTNSNPTGEDTTKEVEHHENGQNIDNKDVVMKSKENGVQNSQLNDQQQQQPSSTQQLQASVLTHKMNDLCIHCGNNERMQNAKKKKWKKYCQTCIDKLMKRQPPSFINNVVGGSTLQASSTVGVSATSTSTVVNGLGGLVAQLAENQSNQQLLATTTNNNGRMGIMKRPLNQLAGTTSNDQAIKRQRLSSNTTKSVVAQTNGDTVSNGNGSADGKADSSANNNEMDKMWLPAGGSKEPSKWTVQEVYEFISHLEGCADLAEGFKSQEIDGQALMLIKEDHIIDILNTKLGPALKICRKIKELKDEFNY